MNLDPLTGFPVSSRSVATSSLVSTSKTSGVWFHAYFPVQAESDPPMTTLREIDIACLDRGHLSSVEDEKLSALLIADPELRLVRSQAGPVRPVRDLLWPRKNAMEGLPFRKVDDIESDVVAETYEGESLAAVDGIRKDAALADVRDLHDYLIRRGVENGERCTRS